MTSFETLFVVLFSLFLASSAITVVNLSSERKAVVEAHAVARASAKYKIVVAAVLSGDKVKRHSELFVADAEGAAAILNALIFLGNETADRDAFALATSHGNLVSPRKHHNTNGGGGGGGSFHLPMAESDLIRQEGLSNATLAGLRFSPTFVRAATASQDGKGWSGKRGSESGGGGGGDGAVVNKEGSARQLSEEAEYALRQHLTKRGVALLRVVAPADKLAARQATPGSLDYRRRRGEPVSFLECASRTSAYSAAWVADRQLLLSVDMSPRASLEWHSHNLFIQVFYHMRKPERGTYGYAFKTTSYRDFYVNHLSHWDHKHKEADVEKMSEAVERECALLHKTRVESTLSPPPSQRVKNVSLSPPGSSSSSSSSRLDLLPHTGTHATVPGALSASRQQQHEQQRQQGSASGGGVRGGWKSAALVPFWGGSAAASGGNAHSTSKHEVKVRQLAGTVCSAMRPFHTVLVGVCSAVDRNAVLAQVGVKWGVEPFAAIELKPMSFQESVPHRSKAQLMANMKHLNLNPQGLSVEQQAQELTKHPEALAKIAAMHHGLHHATVTNLSSSHVTGAPMTAKSGEGQVGAEEAAALLVVQFQCSLGVHLPFHLLQFAQGLLARNAREADDDEEEKIGEEAEDKREKGEEGGGVRRKRKAAEKKGRKEHAVEKKNSKVSSKRTRRGGGDSGGNYSSNRYDGDGGDVGMDFNYQRPSSSSSSSSLLSATPTRTSQNRDIARNSSAQQQREPRSSSSSQRASPRRQLSSSQPPPPFARSAAASARFLKSLSWREVDFVYFTEADQITSLSRSSNSGGGGLARIVSMLNGTNYVAPQRMVLRNSAVMSHPDFGERAVTEIVEVNWEKEGGGAEEEESSGGVPRLERRRRLRSAARPAFAGLDADNDQQGANNDAFSLENECSIGGGEPGYLGTAKVHSLPA